MSDDDGDFMQVEELEDESSNNASDADTIPVKRNTKCRSFVWRYFIRDHRNHTAECMTCHNIFSFRGTVSNLGKHLKRIHPKLYKQRFKVQPLQPKRFSFFTSIDDQPSDDEESKQNGTIAVEIECNCNTLDGNHSHECALFVKPPAWQYYEKIQVNTATCRLCQQEVEWASNVQSLAQHIQECHPSIHVQEEITKQQPSQQELIDENESDTEMLSSRAKKRRFKYRPRIERVANGTTGDKEWNDSLERFGSYVASLMRLLPRERAAKYQVQIVERLVKESVRTD